MSSDKQIILGSDEEGNFTGEYFPKMEGHTGEGKHHLAISVFIYNSKGQVLLQLRKHKIFDNIWDMTASTHQLHKEDGSDETDEEATRRAIEVEYGITDKIPLKNYRGVNYFEKYGQYCENEYDVILTGEYNGQLMVNPETAYDINWMEKQEFLKDIEENPKKYTPWTIEAVKLLKKHNFFKP